MTVSPTARSWARKMDVPSEEDVAAWQAEGFGRLVFVRDCHSAAAPSNFGRCFNGDGEGMSAK